jgi:hypothetical protein
MRISSPLGPGDCRAGPHGQAARARELASREEDVSERFSAYYGLFSGHFNRCEPAPMREIVELLLREATARPDCPEALIAYRMFGTTCLYFDDFGAAHQQFRKTLELYDPTRHADFMNRFGVDPRAAAEAYDAVALWVLGRIDEALHLADSALADAESTAHAPTMAFALLWAASIGLFRRNPEAVATHGQAFAGILILSRYEFPAQWAGFAVFFRAGQGGPTLPKSRDSPRCDAASPSFESKANW